MKKVLLATAILFTVSTSIAQVTQEQQREALTQLEIARGEINTVKSLIPKIFRSSVAQNLKNAEERIIYAQQVLSSSPVANQYYCVIQSSFDGNFSAKGSTELEAKENAKQACKAGSRSNGFFCDERKLTCEKQ